MQRRSRWNSQALATVVAGLLTGLLAFLGVWYQEDRRERGDRDKRIAEAQTRREEWNRLEGDVQKLRADVRDRDRQIESLRESRAAPLPAPPATNVQVRKVAANPAPASPPRRTPPAATPQPRRVAADPPPSAAPPADPYVREVQDYRFRLNRCERSGSRVTCGMTITSLRGDHRLTLSGSSYVSTQAEGFRSLAYSGSGIEHPAVRASLGAQSDPGAVASRLVAGEPMTATVVFDGIPASRSTFTVLRPAFWSEREKFFVTFPPVPIR